MDLSLYTRALAGDYNHKWREIGENTNPNALAWSAPQIPPRPDQAWP